ncbi:hypothetical protein ACQKL0_13785 [Peribacillus sp. NPDC097264]|uniref:hypothetical protein n=1 Tax=unclassified Peribacillus TaxID=2675266 RepID=UPI00380C9222
MIVNTVAELCAEVEKVYQPLHVTLTIDILDKRFGPVKAEAEITVCPVESKGYFEILVEELESEHIYAAENGSIYGSFGIDQSIQVYDEVLNTVPFDALIGTGNWKEKMDSYLAEDTLKSQLETVLKNYQFSDMSGKYKFRKICTITDFHLEK